MKLIVNGVTFPLHGYTDPNEYTIIGYISPMYYLCEDKAGNRFALYLPDITEIYPSIFQ